MKSIVLLAVLISLADTPAKPAADRRGDLDSAIDYAIELLEKEEYEQYIKKFGEPEALEKVLKTRTMDELVRGLAKGKAKKTLEALKQVRGKEPKRSEDGHVARFSIAVSGFAKKQMTFVKSGQLWRLRN